MSGEQKTSTTTSTNEPWPKQSPHLERVFKEAESLYDNGGMKYYPKNTVAPLNTQQNRALNNIANLANKGNAAMNMGEKFTKDVLGGKYSGDPFGSQVYHNIENKVLPSVNSQFSASGRYGSGAHADTATRSLTDAFAPYASQQYQQGLDRMGQAANAAQMYEDSDYRAQQGLLNVGNIRQDQAQREIGDAKARYDFYQNEPYANLDRYRNSVGGSYGGTQTNNTPYYEPSWWQQAAGFGLAAAPYVF